MFYVVKETAAGAEIVSTHNSYDEAMAALKPFTTVINVEVIYTIYSHSDAVFFELIEG